MKTRLLSIVVTAALTVSMGLLGKVGCDRMKLEDANHKLNKELMQANLEIGRAETRFGDADKYASELEQVLQDEINTRNAEVTRYGILQAKYLKLKESKGTTKIVKVPGQTIFVDKSVFEPGMVYMAITVDEVIPLHEIEITHHDYTLTAKCISLPEPNDGLEIPYRFDYKLHLDIEAELVETITPSGAVNHYVNIWELDDQGDRQKKFELTKFNMIVNDDRKPEFYWWAPHLDIAAAFMVGTLPPRFSPGASLGVSIMGYGVTKNDLSWRVLRVSADLSDGLPGLGLTPVQYNLGELIPLISNLWAGPHVVYSLEGEWKAGLTIGAVL